MHEHKFNPSTLVFQLSAYLCSFLPYFSWYSIRNALAGTETLFQYIPITLCSIQSLLFQTRLTFLSWEMYWSLISVKWTCSFPSHWSNPNIKIHYLSEHRLLIQVHTELLIAASEFMDCVQSCHCFCRYVPTFPHPWLQSWCYIISIQCLLPRSICLAGYLLGKLYLQWVLD